MRSYVVLEKAFIYDELDNRYSYPQCTNFTDSAGVPRKIFFSKQRALEEAKQENARAFSGLPLGQYADDLFQLTDMTSATVIDNLRLILKKPLSCFDYSHEVLEFVVPDDLDYFQLLEISCLFHKLSFFEMIEVETDE